MAFSFDTFVDDQKQTVVDVVDTITPGQVKQVAQAYKAGLNASPTQVINETLEKFTGIDLSQGAGVDGVGAKVTGFIKDQAADLTMQLEQQILGCINTAIRDLMNKHPEIDFILNFEDRINGILGSFRNKLEQKIDAELRKLAYNKLKIHQTTLFKQRIRAKIKDICPGASPASVPEVQEFNRNVAKLFNKRVVDNVVEDTETTLPASSIVTSKSPVLSQFTSVQGPSEKYKKMFREDVTATNNFVEQKIADTTATVEQETFDQLAATDDNTISEFINSHPIT